MHIKIEDFIKIATKVTKHEVQTLRGKLEQFSLIIPETLKQECLKLLSELPAINNKWAITNEDKVILVQFVTDEVATSINVTKTKVYESRLIELEDPDPRRIAMLQKKIVDAENGRLPGTSVAVLKQSLKSASESTLRMAIEKKIRKDLPEEKAAEVLNKLRKVSKVLMTNFETAPQRLRMTWKSLDGKHCSKALSSGVSIIFESTKQISSSQGWIGEVVNLAKEQEACVSGFYFPEEIGKFSKGKSKLKSKQKLVP